MSLQDLMEMQKADKKAAEIRERLKSVLQEIYDFGYSDDQKTAIKCAKKFNIIIDEKQD